MIDHYRNDDLERLEKEEIYSKAIRAGKRTYFFDVKATKGNDYFLTLTESKKRVEEDGSFYFEKHKIFLYKEDFEKFAEGLDEVVAYIQAAIGGEAPKAAYTDPQKEEFDVDFDQI